MEPPIRSHFDLRVYQLAATLRKRIFVLSLQFPETEKFELTSQVRRSSRSVCACLAEGWRKRRYKAVWISKLTDAEQEAAETQIWIETASECGYIDLESAKKLIADYDVVLAQLTLMSVRWQKWVLP